MNIKQSSKAILKELYQTLNEESYCLDIKFKALTISKQVGITYENLLLCLFYLIDKNLIDGSVLHSTVVNEDTVIKLTITSAGIDLIEGQI